MLPLFVTCGFQQVTRQLWWHVRGSLLDDEEPTYALIAHQDHAIQLMVAQAVGLEKLTTMSQAREEVGELVWAARVSWLATLVKNLPQSVYNDFVFRSAELLETADDKAALSFEMVNNSNTSKYLVNVTRHI